MSDQETAIQLIRNEAAELVTRAKAAGLSVLVFNGPDGTIVDIKPLELKIRVHAFAADKIESLHKLVTDTSLKDLLGPDDTMPKGNFFFCSSDRDALKPDVGSRRFAVVDCGKGAEQISGEKFLQSKDFLRLSEEDQVSARRYFAIDIDVEPSASGNGVHIFAVREPK